MGLKLAALKMLGSAALIGVGAVAAKNQTTARKRKGGNCTPCAVAAMTEQARQTVKTGRL